MRTKKVLFFLLFCIASFSSFAQSNLLNAKSPIEIGNKSPAQMIADNDKPLPYAFVDDRDVLMGKMIWEMVDISELINFPLYYPIDTINIGADRRSLFDVLLKEIKKGTITEVYNDDYFNIKKTLKDMSSSFTYVDTTTAGVEEYNIHLTEYKSGKKKLDPQYINKRELSSQDIVGYRVKGYWYFDKRQGELRYRMIALCPVAPEARDIGAENPDVIDLFWVYFPAIRTILHHAKAFNDKNSAQPISFEQILNSRRFNGLIYKEENMYGDRAIAEYEKDNAQNQLFESERVKDKIRNFEHDMWSY